MQKKVNKDALRRRIARLSGRSAANRRQACPGYDGIAATSAAKAAFWAKLMHEVDPEEKLPLDERLHKAKLLWRSRMDEAKLVKARKALRRAA
jgi:hypothetical protein